MFRRNISILLAAASIKGNTKDNNNNSNNRSPGKKNFTRQHPPHHHHQKAKKNVDSSILSLDLGNNIQVKVISDLTHETPTPHLANEGSPNALDSSVVEEREKDIFLPDVINSSVLSINENALLSDAATSPSTPSTKKSGLLQDGEETTSVEVEAIREAFTTLRHTALPTLFGFVSTIEQEMQSAWRNNHNNNKNTEDGDDNESAPPPVLAAAPPEVWDALLHTEAGQQQLTQVSGALQTITDCLEHIHNRGRMTGRRYEKSFPAALTAHLLRVTGPLLHRVLQEAQHEVKQVRERRKESKKSTTAEGETSTALTIEEKEKNTAPLLERYVASFYRVRRALALRIRSTSDVLPSATVVESLAFLQLCDALSDDILGPVIAELQQRHTNADPLRRKPHHYSLLSHMVSSVPEGEAVLQKGGATVLLRVLGRQSIPGHFHLHQFVHTVLLPVVGEELATTASMSEVALVDLTRCFVRYEVAGDYVTQLTRLWEPHLASMSISACSSFLRLLGEPPAWASEDPKRARTRGSKSLRSLKGGSRRLVSSASEDYLPLTHRVCETVVARGQEVARALQDTTAAVERELQDWLDLMPMLLTVQHTEWASVYLLTADVLLSLIQRALQNECIKNQNHENNDIWETVLPVDKVEAVVKRVIHRNTLIPHHPLHLLLLKRLLHSPKGLTNVRTANLTLLSMELLSGPTPSLGKEIENENKDTDDDKKKSHQPHSIVSSDPLVVFQPYFTNAIDPEDRQRAMALFRRHGTKLGFTSFVAAMCVVPLETLPLPSLQKVLVHFTSIASALRPQWLVKGISAAVRLQVHQHTQTESSPLPIVDPVSVQRWLSRFTLNDVMRTIDIDSCIMLLRVFQLDEKYSIDSAIALRNVVYRVGFLLNRDEIEGAVPLESIPPLVEALQAADVFYTQHFSRLCRLLLSEVQQAPLSVFLPAFHSVADEYTRRAVRGSLFADVWELLRNRLTGEEGKGEALTSVEEVVSACNGFACLDLDDRPLFLTLAHRLWQLLLERVNPLEGEGKGKTAYDYEIDNDGSDEEVQRRQQSLRWEVQQAIQSLTPSATAVLIDTALYWSHPTATAALLLPSLASLRQHCHQLYPIDVVHVMPVLLYALRDVEEQLLLPSPSNPPPHWIFALSDGEKEFLLRLLHRAYDGCRTFFLFLYHDVSPVKESPPPPPQEKEEGGEKKEEASTALADPRPSPSLPTELHSIDEIELHSEGYRALFTAKIRSSILVVPKTLFIRILVALSYSGMQDTELAAVCAKRFLTGTSAHRQVLQSIEIQTLTDLFLALCFHFIPPPSTVVAKKEGTEPKEEEEEGKEEESESSSSSHRKFLAPVLDALWYRTDELSIPQLNAILKCLHYYIEPSKLDQDFVERLQRQKETILELDQKVKEKKEEGKEREAELNTPPPPSASTTQTLNKPPPPPPPADEVNISPDDLFDW